MDLSTKRIVVTGSHGFLGQHVLQVLESRGCALGGDLSTTHIGPQVIGQI